MKVIKFDHLTSTTREVHCPDGGFISYRYLLESDGMGYSVHRTVVPKGPPQRWHYTNHLESCLCIVGYGELVNLATGEKHIIESGTMYALDEHDDHTFQAFEDTVLICVFNPPVTGREVHGPDRSYACGVLHE